MAVKGGVWKRRTRDMDHIGNNVRGGTESVEGASSTRAAVLRKFKTARAKRRNQQ